jgi:hypothetical protein
VPRARRSSSNSRGLKQAAHFYLNGQPVGLYENGVTACGLDLTALVKFGGQDNVLAVKVDNTIEYKEEATGTPFEWKFSNSNPSFGGLNRDVWLHVMGKVYQTLPLYENLKTTGVYIYGKNYDINGKTAQVNVESQVRNESPMPQPSRSRRRSWTLTASCARNSPARRRISPVDRPRHSRPTGRSPARISGT